MSRTHIDNLGFAVFMLLLDSSLLMWVEIWGGRGKFQPSLVKWPQGPQNELILRTPWGRGYSICHERQNGSNIGAVSHVERKY